MKQQWFRVEFQCLLHLQSQVLRLALIVALSTIQQRVQCYYIATPIYTHTHTHTNPHTPTHTYTHTHTHNYYYTRINCSSNVRPRVYAVVLQWQVCMALQCCCVVLLWQICMALQCCCVMLQWQVCMVLQCCCVVLKWQVCMTL